MCPLASEVRRPSVLPPRGAILDGFSVLNAPLWHPLLSKSPFITRDPLQSSCAVTGATWGLQGRTFAVGNYIDVPLQAVKGNIISKVKTGANYYGPNNLIVHLSDGNLAYYYCIATMHAAPNLIDYAMKVSNDGGQTWGAETIILHAFTTANPLCFQSFGGGVTPTGAVVLQFAQAQDANFAINRIAKIWYVRSPDGYDWSAAPVALLDFGAGYIGDPSELLYVPTKGLMMPWQFWIPPATDEEHIAWSTDDGVTFGDLQLVSNDAVMPSEGSYVYVGAYLGAGKIIGLLRTEVAPYHIYQVTSSDYGATWSALSDTGWGAAAPYGWRAGMTLLADGKSLFVAAGNRSNDNYEIKIVDASVAWGNPGIWGSTPVAFVFDHDPAGDTCGTSVTMHGAVPVVAYNYSGVAFMGAFPQPLLAGGTISVWFRKLVAGETQGQLFSISRNADNVVTQFAVWVDNRGVAKLTQALGASLNVNGVVQWGIVVGSATYDPDTDFAEHLLTITHDGVTPTMYLDGVVVGAFDVSLNKTKWFSSLFGAVSPSDKCTIGGRRANGAFSSGYDGVIGEILNYNRNLAIQGTRQNRLATKWRYI